MLTPLKTNRAPSKKVEHTVVSLHINRSHLDQTKPPKIYELQKVKPKAIERLDLYQTRKLKPGNVLFSNFQFTAPPLMLSSWLMSDKYIELDQIEEYRWIDFGRQFQARVELRSSHIFNRTCCSALSPVQK